MNWYVANLLSLTLHLMNYIETAPATFASGRGVYSYGTFSQRKILLFHHLALLFLMVAFCSASNNQICVCVCVFSLTLPIAMLTMRF